jgi:hypothetical protein
MKHIPQIKFHFAKDMWMCSFFRSFVPSLWLQELGASHLLTSKASGQHIPPTTNSTKVGKKKDIPRAK